MTEKTPEQLVARTLAEGAIVQTSLLAFLASRMVKSGDLSMADVDHFLARLQGRGSLLPASQTAIASFREALVNLSGESPVNPTD